MTNLLLLFIIIIYWAGVKPCPPLLSPNFWPILPALDDNDDRVAIGGIDKWQGKPKY
jgi:hypothetical protein